MAAQTQGPLNWQTPIVNHDGTPTFEFMRKWETQIAANGSIPDLSTAAKVSAYLDKISSTANAILLRGTSQWGGLTAPSDATKFLNGANPPAFAKVKDSDLSVSDVTSNNVSNTAHGFAPKLPNDATKYLDGTGAYSTPPGGGTGANPTATASDTAVNGSATTFMRSDAAPAIQKATASQFGLVKVDGTTITESGGVISAASAQIPYAEFAGYPTTATNATGDATTYTIPNFTAEKNVGSAMNTATGVWTAPAKGLAIVSGVFGFGGLTASHTKGYCYAIRNGTDPFYCFFGNTANLRDSSNNAFLPMSAAIPVNAGDTLVFEARVSNGTKVVTLWGGISQTYLGITFFKDSASGGGGGGGFSGWFITPAGGHATSGTGPAYLHTPILLPAGYTVRGTDFLPLATSGTLTYGAALYALAGGASPVPGALLASASGLTTGVTAGTRAQSDFSTPYTAVADMLVWASMFISTSISIAQSVGESAFRTSSSTWPPPSTALTVTAATTYAVAAYGDPP